jgi:hypothetical protein
MNKKDLFFFELLSTILVIFLGFILHFLYEWTNYNAFVATFSAINESVWEHLKLLFFPILLTILIGNYLFNNNYVCIKSKGLVLGMIFIIVFFYTYTGILGFNIPFLDISSFIFAVIICEIYTYKKFNNHECNKKIGFIFLLIFFISFITFTFHTPEIGIFQDPVTGDYGIKEKERSYLSN